VQKIFWELPSKRNMVLKNDTEKEETEKTADW
jgi:hypothetical protein